MRRGYSLGRRQSAVDHTRLAILAAARELVASDETEVTTGAVARRAGVSRITVYNHFGSRTGLLRELARQARRLAVGEHRSEPGREMEGDELRRRISFSCAQWSSDPALFRRLPHFADLDAESPSNRALAERLAAAGALRPGCSLKEAEDVIGAITSFHLFDALHKDGRRSQAAVVEILMRLASSILNPGPAHDS